MYSTCVLCLRFKEEDYKSYTPGYNGIVERSRSIQSGKQETPSWRHRLIPSIMMMLLLFMGLRLLMLHLILLIRKQKSTTTAMIYGFTQATRTDFDPTLFWVILSRHLEIKQTQHMSKSFDFFQDQTDGIEKEPSNFTRNVRCECPGECKLRLL